MTGIGVKKELMKKGDTVMLSSNGLSNVQIRVRKQSRITRIAFAKENVDFFTRKTFILLSNSCLEETQLDLNCDDYDNVFTCRTRWHDPKRESCSTYEDNNYCTKEGS